MEVEKTKWHSASPHLYIYCSAHVTAAIPRGASAFPGPTRHHALQLVSSTHRPPTQHF